MKEFGQRTADASRGWRICEREPHHEDRFASADAETIDHFAEEAHQGATVAIREATTTTEADVVCKQDRG